MSVRLLEVDAKNFYGLKNGINVNHVHLKFSNNSFIVIRGENGSGKSVLVREILQPLPSQSISLIPGVEASHMLVYDVDGIIYRCELFYPIIPSQIDPLTKLPKRGTTKGYIKKQTENGFVELNPTGSVTNYTNLISDIMGLDSLFLSLLHISTEVGGLVQKTPAERKKLISYILDSVTIFYNILDVCKKRELVYKSNLADLSTKISMIGDTAQLQEAYKKVQARYDELLKNIEISKKNIAKAESKVELLDPGKQLQTEYHSLYAEKEKNKITLDKIAQQIAILVNNDGIPMMENVNEYMGYLDKIKQEHNNNCMKIESLQLQNSKLLDENDRIEKEIAPLQCQLDSYHIEWNIDDMINIINEQRTKISGYEKFFETIDMSTVTNITKDEYITALETLKSMSYMLDDILTAYNRTIISVSLNHINKSVKDYVLKANSIDNQISNFETQLREKEKEVSYYCGLLDRMSILNNRPSSCIVEDCPFIKDAVECKNKNPEMHLSMLELETAQIENTIIELKKEKQISLDLAECTKSLNQMFQLFKSNSRIIDKMQVSEELKSIDVMISFILEERNPFYQIDSIYPLIDRANMYEEYKLVKDKLDKLESEYTLYQSKSELIATITSAIEMKKERIPAIKSEISSNLSEISQLKETNDKIQMMIPSIEASMKLSNEYSEIIEVNKRLENRALEIEDSVSKIQYEIEQINAMRNQLESYKSDLEPIEKDKEKINYEMKLLAEYKEEFQAISKNYEFVSTLKKYVNPRQEDGIQNAFIEVYINDIINKANELLMQMFDGKIRMLQADLSNGFTIPCLSKNSNMPMADISLCSRSEKSAMNLFLGVTLAEQSSSNYNILAIDEADEGYDYYNRLEFMNLLSIVRKEHHISQTFIISHTQELDDSTADIITLSKRNSSITIEYR